jgi:membrane protein YqaA with SNARE-associated domain
MLRRLYDWVLELAEHRLALPARAFVSFVESSVFPITPLVMVVPMVLARPSRVWLITGTCTLASVAGGIFGWWIGQTLFEEVGRPVLELYGKADMIDDFAAWFNEVGAEAVIFAALTPFPYKVVTIASGVTGLDLWTLTWASLVGRGIQFFSVALAVWWFGERAKALIERHMTALATATAVLIIGGLALVRFVGG